MTKKEITSFHIRGLCLETHPYVKMETYEIEKQSLFPEQLDCK